MQSDTIAGVDETIGAPTETTTAPDAAAPPIDETAVPVEGDGPVDAPAAPAAEPAPAHGGTGLAIEMARASFASDLAKAENGVLRYGFDQSRAWQEVAALNETVAACEREWNRCKAETKGAKEDYDDAVEALTARIAALDEERRRPALPLEGTTVLTFPGTPRACAFTQRTGQPCPVCRQRAASPIDAPADSPQHPDHAEHDQAATEASARAFLDRLAEAEVFLEVVEVVSLDLTVRAALEQWLNERAVLDAAQAGDAEVAHLPYPDAFARRAHVAAEPDIDGGSGQACRRCGRQLLDDVDIADDGTYPVGAHVGLDCDGAHEVARPTAKRGRAKKNRPAPEAERAEQLAAGKDAAAAEADARTAHSDDDPDALPL